MIESFAGTPNVLHEWRYMGNYQQFRMEHFSSEQYKEAKSENGPERQGVTLKSSSSVEQ
jgi:hypothetical protein